MLEGAGGFVILAARAAIAAFRPPLRLRATLYQMHVQGVRALGLAAVAGAFTGMALALQFGAGLARFSAQSILPELTTLGLFRELLPVVIGLVIGGRIGAGIAAELGTMSVTEQIDAVRALGADPVAELVVPRVAAATIVLPLVTVFADGVATAGAMLVARLDEGIHARFFIDASRRFVLPGDFLFGVVKTAAFGLSIALLACWYGGRARGGADGVGRATTRTVVNGALAVIVIDYFLSRAFGPVLAQGPQM